MSFLTLAPSPGPSPCAALLCPRAGLAPAGPCRGPTAAASKHAHNRPADAARLSNHRRLGRAGQIQVPFNGGKGRAREGYARCCRFISNKAVSSLYDDVFLRIMKAQKDGLLEYHLAPNTDVVEDWKNYIYTVRCHVVACPWLRLLLLARLSHAGLRACQHGMAYPLLWGRCWSLISPRTHPLSGASCT